MNKPPKNTLVGAIEAGGTKFVCAVGTCPQDLSRTKFPSGNNPGQVLSAVTNWLCEPQRLRGKLQAVGIGSFGPVDFDRDSPTLKEDIGNFIVPSLLGDDAGLCGAMALAQQSIA